MNILTSETVGGVLKITLNRPKAFNSFNTQLAKQLQNELDKAQNDNTIRAVLLTGSGKAFSTGQDIKELLDPDGPEFSSILSDNYNPIVKKIRDLNKPIVAAPYQYHSIPKNDKVSFAEITGTLVISSTTITVRVIGVAIFPLESV